MARHTFTRQELYELVWSEPMTKLAKRFNISDRGLAKACVKAEIPVPWRGYWAKHQAGHKVSRPTLPPAQPGQVCQVTIAPPGSKAADSTPPPPPPSVRDRIAEEQRPEKKVAVPKALRNPHRIIAAWLEENRRELKEAQRDPWLRRLHEPLDKSEVSRRRLRILSTLFKATRGPRLWPDR